LTLESRQKKLGPKNGLRVLAEVASDYIRHCSICGKFSELKITWLGANHSDPVECLAFNHAVPCPICAAQHNLTSMSAKDVACDLQEEASEGQREQESKGTKGT